jgi:hypothetical protein
MIKAEPQSRAAHVADDCGRVQAAINIASGCSKARKSAVFPEFWDVRTLL